MKILITGGTVFLSRTMAEYFAGSEHEVYVLNRNTMPQPQGVRLIEADRRKLYDSLKEKYFDAVIDVTAYDATDVDSLLDALDYYGKYILISSSAVYPETTSLPFKETAPLGANKFWGQYGTDKINAERTLLQRDPRAYIIRPPYIYGELNNIYREAFVFDCAECDRTFYIPSVRLSLQFVYARDICRFTDKLLLDSPKQNIFNIGSAPMTAQDWVTKCYAAVGKTPRFAYVDGTTEQRNYFPFYNYSYELDCTEQKKIMHDLTDFEVGINNTYKQYANNKTLVKRKDYINFIDEHLQKQ